MRVIRAITIAAALLATLAVAAPAHADIVPPRPFYADSGDACVYGYTEGDLLWVTPGPLPAIAVNVSGSVVDRPTPTDPRACRDDGFYSTATFTAYSGTVVVGSQAVRADNGPVPFQFSLGTNRPGAPVMRQGRDLPPHLHHPNGIAASRTRAAQATGSGQPDDRVWTSQALLRPSGSRC